MAIINPDGLFSGERLARCSDEAQLHWVRLFTASNTFGRLELSYQNIIQLAYRSFHAKPTEVQIAGWIQEYFDNFLLFVYDSEDGSTWGQWLTSSEYLSRYQTAADRRSPAPDKKELEEYRLRYISSKKSKSLRINRISEPHSTTPNHTEPHHTVTVHTEPTSDVVGEPQAEEQGEKRKSFEINNVSEPPQTVRLGIGIGIGIGEEQIQKPCGAEKRATVARPVEILPAAPFAGIAPPFEWPEIPPDPDPPPPPAPELKPKPPKPATKTDIGKIRHADFKAAIWAYWQSMNAGIDMPWDGAEGKNLEIWLRASPRTTIEQFRQYLVNRCRSQEVNHAERPSLWISKITNYAAGPLDRFGKPLFGTSDNGRPSKSPSQYEMDRERQLAEIAEARKAAGRA